MEKFEKNRRIASTFRRSTNLKPIRDFSFAGRSNVFHICYHSQEVHCLTVVALDHGCWNGSGSIYHYANGKHLYDILRDDKSKFFQHLSHFHFHCQNFNDLELILYKGSWSNVNMPIESWYTTFCWLPEVTCSPSLPIFKICIVEICINLAVTISIGQSQIQIRQSKLHVQLNIEYQKQCFPYLSPFPKHSLSNGAWSWSAFWNRLRWNRNTPIKSAYFPSYLMAAVMFSVSKFPRYSCRNVLNRNLSYRMRQRKM